MYDENSVQIPEALPQQNPTKYPRNPRNIIDGDQRLQDPLQHLGTRMRQRGYTLPQVLQTYVYGQSQPDPSGEPGVEHIVLNSIAHAQMRRRIVVKDDSVIKTVDPREPIPETTRPSTPPNNTKAKKKQQLAKKRARSMNG